MINKTDKRFDSSSDIFFSKKQLAIEIFHFWNFVAGNFGILTKHRSSSKLVKKGIKKVEKCLVFNSSINIKRSIIRYNKLLSLNYSKISKGKAEATTTFDSFFGFDQYTKQRIFSFNRISIDSNFKSWFKECLKETVFDKYSLNKLKKCENNEFYNLFVALYKENFNKIQDSLVNDKLKYANSFEKVYSYYKKNEDKFNKIFINSFFDFLENFFKVVKSKYYWFDTIDLVFLTSDRLFNKIDDIFEKEGLWR